MSIKTSGGSASFPDPNTPPAGYPINQTTGAAPFMTLPQLKPTQKQCDPTRLQALSSGGMLVGLVDGSVRNVTLIVAFWLPCPADLPNVEEYKFVASRKEIKPVEMKAKEAAAFYDDVIHQIALRTVHEIVVADYAAQVEAVVFNGWVRGIDPKTGKAFTSCILSY
jgi:hypothetical protein